MKKKIETKYPSDLTDKEWEEICPLFICMEFLPQGLPERFMGRNPSTLN